MDETRNYILSAATALQKLQRMAYEIVEQNMGDFDQAFLHQVSPFHNILFYFHEYMFL